MTTKYFINPFALNGDKTEINDAQNTDGTVSYAQGYSFDYQRDLSIDPAAKAPDRLTFNGILYDITTAIIQYQQNSTPDWQSFQTYPNYARVRYNDIVYESRVDSNTNNRPDVTPVAWSAVQAIANYALTSNITSPVQANWTQSNTADLSYIRNKPTNVSAFINDAGYVNAAGAISAVSPYLNGFSSSEFDPPTGVLPSNGGAFYIINSNQTLPVTANFKVGQSICILSVEAWIQM